MPEVRLLTADDWETWRDLRLQALAEAPGAFGSTLADWQGENDREERWRSRLDSADVNLVIGLDDEAAGMASGIRTGRASVAELISMWVAPAARGQGVGDLLIDGVVRWARSIGAGKLILNVKTHNASAIGLYRRHGFVPAGPSDQDPDRDPDEETMVLDLATAGDI